MDSQMIKIGADEIILYLRKNGYCKDVPNDGITGLGRKIHDLIVNELAGNKVEESGQAIWEENDKNVHQYGLPKTSAQYLIKAEMLPVLYLKISNW